MFVPGVTKPGSTSDGFWPHLERADDRNWSMMTWAAFTKSPNCASQMTRPSGCSSE